MQTLSINADDLLTALRERNPQVESWLDRQTGDIYQVSAQFDDDEVQEDPAFHAAMTTTPERWLRLPRLSGDIGFQAMRAFACNVAEPGLQMALKAALGRQRAFFHFRDVLASTPALVPVWEQQLRERALAWADAWLAAQGIVRHAEASDATDGCG
ncbi:hypothetical protein HPT27_05825 [Permianibacter sp. IMCC34836]|uniref:UPF0158 family protein n=1 Tax=Permianibacter fluminis TaxID=2738515 RepID=UPI00155488A9|nr:UPF0158 family protein [Permianibacter fluminis]NQD36535.1 hypothetical protein [Permianibacter fluminis]